MESTGKDTGLFLYEAKLEYGNLSPEELDNLCENFFERHKDASSSANYMLPSDPKKLDPLKESPDFIQNQCFWMYLRTFQLEYRSHGIGDSPFLLENRLNETKEAAFMKALEVFTMLVGIAKQSGIWLKWNNEAKVLKQQLAVNLDFIGEIVSEENTRLRDLFIDEKVKEMMKDTKRLAKINFPRLFQKKGRDYFYPSDRLSDFFAACMVQYPNYELKSVGKSMDAGVKDEMRKLYMKSLKKFGNELVSINERHLGKILNRVMGFIRAIFHEAGYEAVCDKSFLNRNKREMIVKERKGELFDGLIFFCQRAFEDQRDVETLMEFLEKSVNKMEKHILSQLKKTDKAATNDYIVR